MFNERRRGVGIDKSNPLKPINTVINAPKGRTKSEEPRKKVITSSDLIRQAIRNGGSDLNLNENTLYPYPSKINKPTSLDNETFPDGEFCLCVINICTQKRFLCRVGRFWFNDG